MKALNSSNKPRDVDPAAQLPNACSMYGFRAESGGQSLYYIRNRDICSGLQLCHCDLFERGGFASVGLQRPL